MSEPFYTFLPDGVTVVSRQACRIRTIYAPLCGPEASGLKSAISPFLSGVIKIDKFHYLTKPCSREDLRWPCREFFIHIEGKKGPQIVSLAQESPDAVVELGLLWHKRVCPHKTAG